MKHIGETTADALVEENAVKCLMNAVHGQTTVQAALFAVGGVTKLLKIFTKFPNTTSGKQKLHRKQDATQTQYNRY